MDLKAFYKKVRDIEGEIQEPFQVVVSLATPDGGRAGIAAETTKALAAKMVAQGAARMATAEEAAAFHATALRKKERADQLAAAARVQLTVLTPSELGRLRDSASTRED